MKFLKLFAWKGLSVHHPLKKGLTVLLLSAAILFSRESNAQSVSLTSIGVPYTQNFNTLSNTAGSTTNVLTIPGWFMTETGGGARDNEQYAVDNGGSTTGDTYSYGTVATTERALGGLRSGTLIPNFGASFTNNTGNTITSLVISYKGEEWRLGTAARTDQLNFEYSLNATDLVTGAWTNTAALNFVTPFTTTAGARDGNATGNYTILSATITGLSIPNGATFWIRFTDIDATGADDGLSVDDFSITPQAACSVFETFESFPAGPAGFSSGGINFTLQPNPNYQVDVLALAGYLSSSNFLDNYNNSANNLRLIGSSTFKVKSLYCYPSTTADGSVNQTAGVNVTFTGKLGGVTKFTYSPPAADFTGADWADPVNRGFTLINFATPGDDNIVIDELVMTAGGTTIYMAMDQLSFCPAAVCPVITVTNPGTTTGTVGTAFSQNFTQSGGALPVSFTTASTLPTGLSLATNGTLNGTPTQSGSFPIVVKATDANTCFGNGATYTLVISCQTITVTNPAVTTGNNGSPFSQTFTQTGALGGATFTINTGTLPTGLTLSPAGVLSGTPTQTGPFTITVKVTDGNGCTGIGASYNLVIGAPAAQMSASLRDNLQVDVNGNTQANNGDQLRYTNTVRNTGTVDAAGVNFNDSVPVNTTLVPGSRVTSALAIDDNFTATSNAPFGSGNLITNDFGLPSVSVVSFGTTASLGTTTAAGNIGTTDNGGTLTVNANGTFSYISALNFTGTDKFMYIATTGVAGLPNNDAVVTIIVNPDISFTTTPVNILCNGASTGSITFSGVSGGSGSGYTYSITGAGGTYQASPSFTGLAAGTYNPAVKDGTGYIKTGAPITLTQPASAVSFTTTDVNNTCAGGTSGSITFNASGGTPGYTYSINGGTSYQASNVFSGLPAGVYNLAVKDANNCVATGSTNLVDPAAVTFTFSKTNVTCFGAADGTITFNPPSGGTGPYTYSINGTGGPFTGTSNYTGLAPNTYNLVVKDANLCNSATQPTTVTEPVQIVVSGTVPPLTYNVAMTPVTFTKTGGVGSPANPWSVSSGTLPTNLTLNTATGQLSGTPNQVGLFPVTIRYTDANGCFGNLSITIDVGASLGADTYTGVGNTQLRGGAYTPVPTTPKVDVVSVASNDNSNQTITYAMVGTPSHGNITMNTDGTFIYQPGLGNSTAATFTYSGTSNGTVRNQTVTINFSGMVWYIQGGAAAGTGLSNSPRNSMPSGPIGATGDFIYVEKEVSATNPPGTITMLASQKLIGAGATLNVPTVSPILTIAGAAGNTPTLINTVTLANSVTVDGIDMSTTTNTAVTNAGNTVTGVNFTARTVTATTGTGISITGAGPHSVTMTLTSLTNSNAAYGVNLNNTGGTVTINGGNIGASTSASVNVVGGTVSLTDAGNINQSTAFVPMINVSGGHATGTRAFNGGTLSATNGTGIIFDNADGIYNFNTTGGSATLNFGGIDIVNGSSGTFNFGVSTNITRANGTNGNQGFRVLNSDANVTYSGNMTMGTTTAQMIIIDNHDANTITFQTGNFSTNHQGAVGITVTNCNGGTINFNGVNLPLTTGPFNSVNLQTNPGATINFAPTGTFSINTTTATGFNATGGGTITLTGPSNNINTTTGTGLIITSTNAGGSGITFNSIASTSGQVANINTSTGTKSLGLVNTSSGATTALSLVDAGIVNAGGSSFGSSSISTTSGTGIIINNTTLNLSGAPLFPQFPVNTSTGIGVSVTGGTVAITGGRLQITTTSGTGFSAISGGTVSVTGSAPGVGNTITSTTGTALSVVNTTIGASNLTFQRISSDGASSGIILNNTGASGSLIVSGNGGACTSAGTCTGGAIQNSTGAGISLTSTLNPQFTRLAIVTTVGSGVQGTDVTNFTFQNGFIDNSGGGLAPEVSNIAFNTFNANNLDGTVNILNNTLTNAYFHGIDISNYSGTITSLTISGNTLTSATSGGPASACPVSAPARNPTTCSQGSGIRVLATGNAVVTPSVLDATVSNNIITNFPLGGGIFMIGSNAAVGSPQMTFGIPNDPANILTISGNRIAGQSVANKMNTNAIQVSINGTARGNWEIINNGTLANPITNIAGNVISTSVLGNSTGTVNISGNRIVANHTPNFGGPIGISTGVGKTFGISDVATMTLIIDGNNVSGTDGNGIKVLGGEAQGTMNVRISNNTVGAPVATALREGIRLDAGGATAGTDNDICLQITGNITAGSSDGFDTAPGIRLRKQGTSTTVNAFGIEGMAATNSPGVENYVGGLNTSANGTAGGGGTNGVILGSATSGFTNCSAAPLINPGEGSKLKTTEQKTNNNTLNSKKN